MLFLVLVWPTNTELRYPFPKYVVDSVRILDIRPFWPSIHLFLKAKNSQPLFLRPGGLGMVL